ncbi:MAG TPA: S9 family peptidase [Blastocatellia bacterium]|nr:S9 family peptidase [Blastocatellia bacterium]
MNRIAFKFGMRILLLSALFASVAAQSTQNKLTIQDVFNVETVSDPQISPDGKRIVYVRQFADIMSDKRLSNLWIISFDGTDHRPLTTGNFSDTSPRWSPDGKQIIYISNRDQTPGAPPQIYRRWMDTGETAKLTNLTQSPAGIAISPDGKWISFTMHVPDPPASIVKMPAPPEGAKWADPAKVIDKLVYRFNGAGYLKPGYTHLFVLPSEGGTPRQISSGKFQHGGVAFGASEAVWTPDGKYLLMSANRNQDYEREPRDTNVYEFSVADGSVRALTNRKGPDNSPQISPDGKLIAYTGYEDKYQGYQVTQLHVMNRDGSNQRVISSKWDRDVAGVRWANDGGGLYFTSDDQGDTGLYFITLGGEVKKLLNNVGSSTSAYGGGGSFTIAKSGAFAVTLCNPRNPGDVAAGMLSDGKVKVLTAVNEDMFAGKQIGEVEEIWYQSSKDNRKIQGWIIKPPGFDPSKKYPLILEIHGGPFADYGDRFDLEKQLMAASGYVVLYTNPRGSTSYGAEFGNLIHHAYPGDDFFDLNSGVDAMVAKGYIDPEQLYVTGGSGGGVLTCWMIGRTPRFRAAVTVYPVINWYSFVLTSDIGNWTVNHWFPGYPWDNVEHYEKRNLLSVVKNVKSPTMVLTGEADYRTPMSDSEQYYQALKLLGVESVLVRMPDEPHGIQVRPSHHMSKILHIIGWFDKHRKSDVAVNGN